MILKSNNLKFITEAKKIELAELVKIADGQIQRRLTQDMDSIDIYFPQKNYPISQPISQYLQSRYEQAGGNVTFGDIQFDLGQDVMGLTRNS